MGLQYIRYPSFVPAGTDVTNVTASSPLFSSGGSTPNITIQLADSTHNGYLSFTDWNTFNSKGNGTVTSVSVVTANGLAGSVANPTTTPAITLSTTITGILQGNGTAISAATTGNLTDAGTDGITVTGGTGAVLGSGTSLSQHVADASHNGYLSSTDWSTFNSKQVAGNYITALTGDATATGPGSVALTLATVNGSPGSFGSASTSISATVNGKGLITALSSQSIQIAESQVTNLVSDLAGKAAFKTVSTITTNTSAQANYIYLCNQSGAITVTLPSPSTSGISVEIKDISGNASTNNITIAQNASEKIENIAGSYTFMTNYGYMRFISDGTNWWILS